MIWMMRVVVAWMLWSLVNSLSWASELSAEAVEFSRINEVGRGELLLRTEDPNRYQVVRMTATEVEIDVTGVVARTRMKQTFKNSDFINEVMEGIYAFPLPETAAIDQMKMQIGKRTIIGVIQEKIQARQTYQKAKAQNKKASLVEQVRPDLFTTSVANIAPGEEVVIEIEYQQVLDWKDGQFSLRFPMAVTPRYLPAERVVQENHEKIVDINNGWAMMPTANDGKVVSGHAVGNPPVSLVINLNPGFPLEEIFSRYHKVSIQNPLHGGEEGKRRIELDAQSHQTDQDFVLYWSPGANSVPQGAYFIHQGNGSEHHGLLMVMPPSSETKVISPPREVTYVIDTSGSMAGPSLVQATDALRHSIQRLRPEDTFNIVDFDDDAKSLFDGPHHATVPNLGQADYFIRGMDDDGGTEMLKALKVALTKSHQNSVVNDQRRLKQVVFITDGAVGNEEQLFQFVAANLGDRRLFTVGIGSAPNSYFMRKAAEFGRGSYTYIGDVSDVMPKMNLLLEQMEQAVMTDLKVSFEGETVTKSLPDPIPDLYRGEPISISMKMNSLPQTAILTGTYRGQPWRREISLNQGAEQSGLDVLFGRRMIEHWMDRAVIGESESVVKEAIVQIAHRYHLVSKYTSLVAVDVTPDYVRDELDPLSTDPKTGTKHLQMAQTATSSQLYMVLGAVLILLSMLFYRRQSFVAI